MVRIMTSPRAVIRRLDSVDLGLARELNHLFGVAFEDAETYGGAPPTDAHLAGLLAKDHVIVLVACLGEQVVGGLVAYELDKLERARSEIYIYDLAVSETHRRRGIATALINALRQMAGPRGAHVIFIQADRGDVAAVALYDKLGTREDVLHFDIAVDD